MIRLRCLLLVSGVTACYSIANNNNQAQKPVLDEATSIAKKKEGGFLVKKQAFSADDEREYKLLAITSTHTFSLGKGNLIAEGLKQKEVERWRELVIGIGDYVKKYAPSYLDDYKKIAGASTRLLETIAYAHDVYKEFGVRGDLLDNYLRDKIVVPRRAMNRLARDLASPERKTVFMQNNWQKPTIKELVVWWFLSSNKKNVREVLSRLAIFVELSLDKLLRDVRRLKENNVQVKKPLVPKYKNNNVLSQ